MKRFCTLIILFSLFSFTSLAQYQLKDLDDSELVQKLKSHMNYIASPLRKGRSAGGEGEKDVALYVESILKEYGLDLLSAEGGSTFGLKQENGDTLQSCNILAHIAGYDRDLRDKYIVISANMDNLGAVKVKQNGREKELYYNGANANASSLAMLLELAKLLKINAPLLRRSVIIAAFGSSRRDFAGSWYFTNRYFPDSTKIDAMVDLGPLGKAYDGFYASTTSNNDITAFVKEQNDNLQLIKPQIVTNSFYPSDYINFYQKAIPSVVFSTGKYAEFNTVEDNIDIIDFQNMERELDYIYNFIIALANGPKPRFANEIIEKIQKSQEGIYSYHDCEIKPRFLGSSNPANFMQKWIYHYMKYPNAAVKQGIQGKVLVEFVIDKKGQVKNAQVVKAAHPLLDEEALRLVSSSPNWSPARIGGKKVACSISLYIEFRLTKEYKIGIKK